MRITVQNWGEYQPRKDVKKSSWFRMEHAIALSTKYLSLSQQDLVALLYIFSLCSEENTDTIIVQGVHAKIFARMSEDQLRVSALKLQELGIVLVDVTGSDRPRNASGTLRTDEHNERTDVLNTTSSAAASEVGRPSQLFPTAPDEAGVVKEFFEIRGSLKGRVTFEVQKKWLEMFTPEFVIAKVKALDLWCLNNPDRAPRSRWSAFYSKHMSKDWETYRTKLPRQPQQPARPKSSWAQEQEALNAAAKAQP